MSAQRRGPWSQAEDNYLCQLVHSQGALNWVRIAQLIGTRSPKQCRERYHQNLKPTLNHEPISPEEGLLIERLVGEMGKRWADIARRLNGRSDNAVKNWWNGSMNRKRRLNLRRHHPAQEHSRFNERTQTLSFARPANNRQLTIQTPAYPSLQNINGPSLISPTYSDSSKDSVERAPSLVSDRSSAFSISPRLADAIELGRGLPALRSLARDTYDKERRPSLPSLHDLERVHNSETVRPLDPYEQFGRHLPAEERAPSPFSFPRAFNPHGSEQPLTASSPPRELSHWSPKTSLPLTAPATPVQLPPLRVGFSENLNSAPERDIRMNLSSLLG